MLFSVPTFKEVHEETLSRIADALEELHYGNNEYIIRQGARGDTFYIISRGRVRVTKTNEAGEEQFIREMGKGDFFGEKALKREDVRSANIVAADEKGVDCLVLDRDSYAQLIANLAVFTKHYPDEEAEQAKAQRFAAEFSSLKLSDLKVLATLGIGGFGRVELVQIHNETHRTFALKQLKKHHIVETKQQEHVLNEKRILTECSSDFIIKCVVLFIIIPSISSLQTALPL